MQDFSNFKTKELTKPRDKAWENWGKFEKEGDKVQGILRDVFYRPADGQFREQRAFTLEQADGKFINIGLKREPYFAIKSTDEVRLGDLLTIELVELRPAKQKGYKPTKIYAFSSGTLDENAGNPTVKELEIADAQSQNIVLGIASTATEEKEDASEVPID